MSSVLIRKISSSSLRKLNFIYIFLNLHIVNFLKLKIDIF